MTLASLAAMKKIRFSVNPTDIKVKVVFNNILAFYVDPTY